MPEESSEAVEVFKTCLANQKSTGISAIEGLMQVRSVYETKKHEYMCRFLEKYLAYKF